ncbi:MAG: hypothetical protein M1818_004792 [Claussenomyces sp. TS43310]|nr:MAG: hypothetical protein M1818_004792 [Claussenomyces sp. TS43310]
MEPTLPAEPQVPPKAPITSSNSPEYRRRLADISSRACLLDPLNLLFQRDRCGPSAQVTLDNIYQSTLLRIDAKVGLGSAIVEADGFAAVACWEPPGAVRRNHDVEELRELARERPVYAAFIRDIEAARTKFGIGIWIVNTIIPVHDKGSFVGVEAERGWPRTCQHHSGDEPHFPTRSAVEFEDWVFLLLYDPAVKRCEPWRVPRVFMGADSSQRSKAIASVQREVRLPLEAFQIVGHLGKAAM